MRADENNRYDTRALLTPSQLPLLHPRARDFEAKSKEQPRFLNGSSSSASLRLSGSSAPSWRRQWFWRGRGGICCANLFAFLRPQHLRLLLFLWCEVFDTGFLAEFRNRIAPLIYRHSSSSHGSRVWQWQWLISRCRRREPRKSLHRQSRLQQQQQQQHLHSVK